MRTRRIWGGSPPAKRETLVSDISSCKLLFGRFTTCFLHSRARPKTRFVQLESERAPQSACFRDSTHALRCISMAASDLGPKALNVAALNDLCHLCPPWTQAGCAINAVSREVSKLAADVRRRRRRKLLALRNEIRRHTFVTLRTVKGECSCWWKIHGVRDETVAVCAEIIHVKSHFRA